MLGEYLITILCTVIASSGFWALIERRRTSKSAETKMLIGLGHDRIISLGLEYIRRGDITEDEYDNLYNYLYKPYVEMGGNGTAERIMNEVQKLPIKIAS